MGNSNADNITISSREYQEMRERVQKFASYANHMACIILDAKFEVPSDNERDEAEEVIEAVVDWLV